MAMAMAGGVEGHHLVVCSVGPETVEATAVIVDGFLGHKLVSTVSAPEWVDGGGAKGAKGGGVKGGVKGGKGGVAEERRRAPDGKDYTKAEFSEFYGGSVEWNAAEKAPAGGAGGVGGVVGGAGGVGGGGGSHAGHGPDIRIVDLDQVLAPAAFRRSSLSSSSSSSISQGDLRLAAILSRKGGSAAVDAQAVPDEHDDVRYVEELADTFTRGERSKVDFPLGTFEDQVFHLLEDLQKLPCPPKADADNVKFDRPRRLAAVEDLVRGDGGRPKPSAECQEAVTFWQRVLSPHAMRLAKVADASERHFLFLKQKLYAQRDMVKMLRSALKEVELRAKKSSEQEKAVASALVEDDQSAQEKYVIGS
jgi:hypothetical protein